jgi:hypothetical protein
MAKYRITSLLMIGDSQALLKAVFPAFDGEQAYFDASEIIVTFSTLQTPADLGPLVRVELLPNE